VILADQALKIYIKTHFINGDEVKVFGNWFKLHFIENEGMAYGMKLSVAGASAGKLLLTTFRLIAVGFGFFLLKRISDKPHNGMLVFCGSLILAGAFGNLLDSLFYGEIFSDSPISCFSGYYDSLSAMMQQHNTEMLAKFTKFGDGYGKFMQGRVVDMLYFPVIEIREMPSWIPFLGGKPFVFFEPVFNIADAAISVGVVLLIIKLYFTRQPESATTTTA
jgi:signal peptidase II